MTKCSPGAIVSIEFPFSNLQQNKRRPGIVLADDGQDLLLARLTTHEPRGNFDVALKNWKSARLPLPSTIRLTKLTTLDYRLVHHKIGHIHPEDSAVLVETLTKFCAEIKAQFEL